MQRFARSAMLGTAALAMLAGCDVKTEDPTAGRPEADDKLGAVSTLTPADVTRAAGLVTEGKTYALGVITGPTTPAYPGRSYGITVFSGGPAQGSNQVTAHDDRLETHVGIGSQIDGLAHIGRNGEHYGGHKAADIFAADGLKALGTEHIPPIATRGVMLDMAKHFGVDQLEPLQGFGKDDIEAAAKAQGIEIGAGDVVLFHTGWLPLADSDPAKFIQQQPGLNLEGAQYLAGLGVVAIGSDTAALETMAFADETLFPVHQALLVDHGIYVLESMNTAELAADEAYEFFFVLGQPRFAGSVQAVINPVAIR